MKVNDSWKEGVNYLTGQKVTDASAGILRTSAYIASGKDVMDDTGLTDMALGLGFSIAAIRNKAVLTEKGNAPKVTKDPQIKKAGKLKTKINKLHLPDQLSEMARRIRQNIEASQKAREASNLKEYLKKEKAVLEKIKKASGAEKIYNANGNPDLRALRRPQFDEALKNGFPDGTKLNQHAYNSLFKSGRKDIMIDDIIDALKTKPLQADPGSVKYVNPKTGTSIFVNPETNTVVGIWPQKFKQ